jgi:hypothetical protein
MNLDKIDKAIISELWKSIKAINNIRSIYVLTTAEF